ncbi:MAG: hypothetical protein E7240_02620 [Lachnospiraceae bacterium]|nr:hypothetical protein [Lachnospiraceae bacterium]
MNNFREWLSDNLRYILLLLAILAVALLAFFGIRFLRSRSSMASDAEQETTASIAEPSEMPETTPSAAPATAEERMLDADPSQEVVALINQYYDALSKQDVAALRNTLDFLSDDDAAKLTTSVPITYSDIKTYVKPGPDASSSIAYVYYHYLEEGTTQVLPGLSSMFLTKNASGSFVIKTEQLTAQEEAYLNEAGTDPDIQALIAQVQTEFDTARTASESAQQAGGEEASEGTEETAENTAGGTSRILQDCNVRAGAGYNYNSIGVIPAGTEVTIIGERGKGWTHIQGGGFDGYVGSTFLE